MHSSAALMLHHAEEHGPDFTQHRLGQVIPINSACTMCADLGAGLDRLRAGKIYEMRHKIPGILEITGIFVQSALVVSAWDLDDKTGRMPHLWFFLAKIAFYL